MAPCGSYMRIMSVKGVLMCRMKRLFIQLSRSLFDMHFFFWLAMRARTCPIEFTHLAITSDNIPLKRKVRMSTSFLFGIPVYMASHSGHVPNIWEMPVSECIPSSLTHKMLLVTFPLTVIAFPT
jgi:hypothetical protein